MKHKAFTLLELLVVIGIIGIIMALATVAYSTTQRGGRDAKRKQDLVAVQNALEQYYSANGYQYPAGECNLAASYLKSNWPTDPSNGEQYTGVTACATDSYCICVDLESDTGGNSGASCDFGSGTKTHYCVGNLQ